MAYQSSSGAFRGRPHGRFQGWKRNKSSQAVPETPEPPLGPLVCSVKTSDLDAAAMEFTNSAKIRGTKFVASYSWMDDKATILIPGMKPKQR